MSLRATGRGSVWTPGLSYQHTGFPGTRLFYQLTECDQLALMRVVLLEGRTHSPECLGFISQVDNSDNMGKPDP